jgi:hypothetical protein
VNPASLAAVASGFGIVAAARAAAPLSSGLPAPASNDRRNARRIA